jgi:hypothetical protein
VEHDSSAEIRELHDILDQKLTALVREMEEADWEREKIIWAIDDIIKARWISQIETLREARKSVRENFVSDGNEG